MYQYTPSGAGSQNSDHKSNNNPIVISDDSDDSDDSEGKIFVCLFVCLTSLFLK